MSRFTRALLVGLSASVVAGCEAKKSEEAPAASVDSKKDMGSPATADKGDRTASATESKTVATDTLPVKPEKEPEHITVQHILISFRGRGTKATRPKEAAETLAKELLARAQAGENFDVLVEKFTDDAPPGIYAMANRGVMPSGNEEYARDKMVPAFGNVGFSISPGNIDMAVFDLQASPYGWHIIKRVK